MGEHTGKDTSLIRARYSVRLVAEIVDHDSSIRTPGTSFYPPRGIVDSTNLVHASKGLTRMVAG
jgi:hypothetical protein